MTENNKSIADFVAAYTKTTNKTLKENLIKDIVIDKNLGFLRKKVLAENIAKVCTIDSNTNRFNVDNINQVLFFHITLLKEFTTLDLSDSEKYAEYFDLLDQCGALTDIVSHIPEKEYVELKQFVQLAMDDIVANHYHFQNWFEDVINAFGSSFTSITENMSTDEKSKIIDLVAARSNK